MSRYTLNRSAPFAEVVLGFDPPMRSFFLQCFAKFDDDDAAVWKPRLELLELERVLQGLKLEFPSLLRRVLLFEQQGGLFAYEAGDPAFWKSPKGDFVEVRVHESFSNQLNALIELPSGQRVWVPTHELEPDLRRVGVL